MKRRIAGFATFAVASALALTISSIACAPPEEPSSFRARGSVVTRQKLDGAFQKIFGGKPSYFVFRTATPNTNEQNTFFAEFEQADESIVRAEGTFNYDHDDLGNYIELKRFADAEPFDAGPVDPALGDAAPPSDPTAAVYGVFHFVKTGEKNTLLTKDKRDRIYQFSTISSYCGERGALDCKTDTQRVGTCATKFTCSKTKKCVCSTASQ